MAGFYRFKALENYPECIHAVSTKLISEPYAFSLALHTGEDRASIIDNRKKVSSLLGLGYGLHFIVAEQTHSDHIEMITEQETKGWEKLESSVADCDALITDKKGVMLTILTADCVPVLMFDPYKEVVAAVHAGWKGTKEAIVSKTVEKMQRQYGCDPKDIIAGVAPSIGRCCYEVGRDVAEHFLGATKVLDKRGEKYMLDLPLINKKQLLNSGVIEEHIEMSGVCTACEVDKFFSYRKEQGCSGRFMSMIGLI